MNIPLKESNFNVNLDNLYPEIDLFDHYFVQISRPKIGRFLVVNQDGNVNESNIFSYVIEKIKRKVNEFRGETTQNYTSKNRYLIGFRVMQMLAFGASKSWISSNEIQMLAKRTGLISQGKEDIVFKSFIDALLRSNLTGDAYKEQLKAYYIQHKDDLDKHDIHIIEKEFPLKLEEGGEFDFEKFEDLEIGEEDLKSPVKSPNIPIKGIPNPYASNSCYRNAPNQALHALTPFMEKLRQPLIEGEDLDKREITRQHLINLFDCLEDINSSPKEIKKAQIALRDVIFESELNIELSKEHLGHQQDVLVYLDVILSQVLHHFFDTKVVYSIAEGDIIVPKIYSPPNPQSILRITLYDEINNTVQEQLNKHLSDIYVSDSNNLVNIEGKLVKEHYETTVLVGEPNEFLVMQIGRAQYDPAKIALDVEEELKNSQINDMSPEDKEILKKQMIEDRMLHPTMSTKPIVFPENNIIKIDYISNEGESKSVNYQLKSFVVRHADEIGSGAHYTSYVMKEGDWYHCNDEEITKAGEDEVLEKKSQAYVHFLEKIPGAFVA